MESHYCLLNLSCLCTPPLSSVFLMQAIPPISPRQTRGLRQGCPLSPYPFSFVLSHLFHDVEHSFVSQFGLSGVINTPFPFWDLEYADDTALLSNSAQQLSRLLHLLQNEASIRGFPLNFDKCAHMRFHSTKRGSFSPHLASPCQCPQCHVGHPGASQVPLSDEVKYLGVFLDFLSCNRKISLIAFLNQYLPLDYSIPSWGISFFLHSSLSTVR